MKRRISILYGDHLKLDRESISTHLQKISSRFLIGGIAKTGLEILELCKLRPDLIIMKPNFPDMIGIDIIREIKSRMPSIPILIISHHTDNSNIVEVFRAGAAGYLLEQSNPEQIKETILQIMAGEKVFPESISDSVKATILDPRISRFKRAEKQSLTSRELQILDLISGGSSNREISTLLGISIKTVQSHRTHIMKKLGINNAARLMYYALRHGKSENYAA